LSRGWLIYQITDSMVQLGLARGIQFVPLLMFAHSPLNLKLRVLPEALLDARVGAAQRGIGHQGRAGRHLLL
jgi:hypothetical protein